MTTIKIEQELVISDRFDVCDMHNWVVDRMGDSIAKEFPDEILKGYYEALEYVERMIAAKKLGLNIYQEINLDSSPESFATYEFLSACSEDGVCSFLRVERDSYNKAEPDGIVEGTYILL